MKDVMFVVLRAWNKEKKRVPGSNGTYDVSHTGRMLSPQFNIAY